MISSTPEPFVTLNSGPTVPAEPYLLLLDLERRGIALTTNTRHLLVTPHDQRLTPADRTAIHRWRSHLAMLVECRAPEIES